MDHKLTKDYLKLLRKLEQNYHLPKNITSSLLDYTMLIYQSDMESRYSEPMVWIGMYIALASLCCILAMGADLLHGLRSRKLWFPCKYISVNAASLSVISVAMKLPVDLSGPMPGAVDQMAKLGSMAFMCIVMANLLPCLATMDTNELLTNITALGVLVITLVVNICIEIQTGAVSYGNEIDKLVAYIMGYLFKDDEIDDFMFKSEVPYSTIATIYVTFLLFLLIMHVCSSLAILQSKQIIESKYQQAHEVASKDVQQSTGKLLTIQKLEQHVSNYWIMAGSGSPQFIIACFATTTASGVICALTTILQTLTMLWTISRILGMDYESDYKWSTLLILVVQFVGVVLGTIAPVCRCFPNTCFKVSIKCILNHIKVFKVERYWTQNLYDWKHSSIRLPFRSHKLMVVIKNLKSLTLNFSIKFQEGVVVVCKIITLIPFLFMVCVFYCFCGLKWLLQVVYTSSRKRTENFEQSPFVLKLEDEIELAEKTLKGLSKSMNQLIQKGEKKQPNNLKMLILEKSTKGFQGVKIFDNNGHHVQCSPSKEEYRECWSLPVVTLTTIAVTLPNIEKVEVDNLLKSVREGLEYVIHVEENLNTTDDHVSIHKAAETLWLEVDVSHKWLGIKLQDIASQVNTTASQEATLQIVQLFLKETENKINTEGVGSMDGGDHLTSHSKFTSICALSMSRVCETIIADSEHHKNLFDALSSWIADIMAACLTNIPRVIAMKCHTSAIEKREACVQDAAHLLGETKEIINALQDWDVPSMNPNDLPFIDKWRAYLSDP